MLDKLEATQKITAHIPVNLLHEAQTVTEKGITETLKIALQQLARANAYGDLRKMRGKIKFSIDLDDLRKDKKNDCSRLFRLIDYFQGKETHQTVKLDELFSYHSLILPPVVRVEILSDSLLPKKFVEKLLKLPILDITENFWQRAGLPRSKLASKK